MFIRINPDKENFNERKYMGILRNKIRKLTEELNKRCLTENLSRGLLKY